jgi:hypothetical protein
MRFQYDILDTLYPARDKLTGWGATHMKISTLVRIVLVTSVASAPCVMMSAAARAQDVPGIEICTVEKTMERRTSCLQSNVDFLQKTITKLGIDQQQKLDAANRQIEGLKGAVAGLQKTVDDLRAAQKKTMEDQKKADAPPAKDNAAGAAKDAKPELK